MWLVSPWVKAWMGVVENKCPFLCGYSCRLDYDHSHIIKISYHETLLLIALKRLISLLFTGQKFSGDIVQICLQKNDLGYFFVWQHYQPQAFILAFFWKFYSNIIHTKHIYYHSNILKEGIIDGYFIIFKILWNNTEYIIQNVPWKKTRNQGELWKEQ